MIERSSVNAAVAVAEAGTAGENATAPGGGGGFAPPDLLSTDINSSAGNSGFNVGSPFPESIYTAVNDGFGGSRCMRVTIPVTLDGGSISRTYGLGWSPRTSVHFIWMYRIRANEYPTGDANIKGARCHNSTAGNNGEFYGGVPGWAFDWDGDQALLDVGVYWGAQPSDNATYGVVAYLANLADGQEHWIEVS